MKKILLKAFIITAPFLFITVTYLMTDPFKVLYHYDHLYRNGMPNYVQINRDYATMETFKNNNSTYHYDSYILGSSRSGVYRTATWAKLIGADLAKCFHMDAANESIYGVERKLHYLDKHNLPINNALIIVDHELLSMSANDHSILGIKHHEISGESSLSFQWFYFKCYLDKSFLHAYFDFLIFHKIKPYMKASSALNDDPQFYNLVNNEQSPLKGEKLIAENADSFYKMRMNRFYSRSPQPETLKPVLLPKNVAILRSAADILRRHKTKYEIIINPLYDQKLMAAQDMAFLKSIFGAAHIHDFSGKNTITDDIHNYYEESHYRMTVADSLMRVVYQ